MFADSSLQEIPSLKDEEFNLFHAIDRELFTKLVVDLGRDTAESMKVMAFLMWLEQQSTGGMTAVKKMLSLPSWLINQLANESVMCLNYAESSSSSSTSTSWDDINLCYELKYLPELLGRNVVMKFFYDHRVLVLEGVTRLCTQVCARAFKDIIINHHHRVMMINPHASSSSSPSPSWINQDSMMWRMGMGMGMGMGNDHHGLLDAASMFNYHQHAMPSQPAAMVHDHHDLSRLLSNLNLGEEEENQVDPEDRTIFLTFSKGYPLSETEVLDFFTSLYGDFIEEIHMQRAAPGEQPLYARLVTRNASVINTVVRGGKAKYNINGKHVCVRKFIKRSQSFSASSSSASAPNTAATPFGGNPIILLTNYGGILGEKLQ